MVGSGFFNDNESIQLEVGLTAKEYKREHGKLETLKPVKRGQQNSYTYRIEAPLKNTDGYKIQGCISNIKKKILTEA